MIAFTRFCAVVAASSGSVKVNSLTIKSYIGGTSLDTALYSDGCSVACILAFLDNLSLVSRDCSIFNDNLYLTNLSIAIEQLDNNLATLMRSNSCLITLAYNSCDGIIRRGYLINISAADFSPREGLSSCIRGCESQLGNGRNSLSISLCGNLTEAILECECSNDVAVDLASQVSDLVGVNVVELVVDEGLYQNRIGLSLDIRSTVEAVYNGQQNVLVIVAILTVNLRTTIDAVVLDILVEVGIGNIQVAYRVQVLVVVEVNLASPYATLPYLTSVMMRRDTS